MIRLGNKCSAYASCGAGLAILLTSQVLTAQQVPREFSYGAQATSQPMPIGTRSQAFQSQPFSTPTVQQSQPTLQKPPALSGPQAGSRSQALVRPATYSESNDTIGPQVGTLQIVPNRVVPQRVPLGNPVRLGDTSRSDQNARTRIVRTVSSLGVVGGLMMGFIWWTRKNQSDSAYVPATDLVEVVGRVALDAKHKAHIVRFGDRLLLLSLDGSGVSKLGEIGTGEIEQPSSSDSAAFQRRVSSI